MLASVGFFWVAFARRISDLRTAIIIMLMSKMMMTMTMMSACTRELRVQTYTQIVVVAAASRRESSAFLA